MRPDDATKGSSQKVWWICKNGHEWEAQVKSRNSGCGCPVCTKGRKKPK
ncbi:zinc-ribbon domain-containing protein [Solibaculum mannosilyticum]